MRANHRMGPDTAPLLDRGKPAKHHMIANFGVAAQRRIIGENDIIANNTVMRNMSPGKEQTIITNDGFHCVNGGAWMHRDMLSDNAVGPDAQPRGLVVVTRMLWWTAQNGKREDFSTRADTRVAVNDDMAVKPNTIVKDDIAPDDRIGADRDIPPNPCGWADDCRRMNCR
jgi:hypothetical protein